MLGYRKEVKRCWGEDRRFLDRIQSVNEVEVLFDAACDGGIGSSIAFFSVGSTRIMSALASRFS